MAFARLTRLDDSDVFINPGDVSRFAPPATGKNAGAGTRIVFCGGGSQDVKELPTEVEERLGGA